MLRACRIRRGLVLDIGCGAGQLSVHLLRAGFTSVGIDISPAMVRIARREWSTSRFIRGSIVNMKLPQAAAAVAIGEVFNYVKSKQDMQRAFHNVFSALNPGGVLIFDIKEALPGRQRRYRSNARWGKDWAIAVEVEEDPRANRLTRQIVMFRKSGRFYQRTDETHQQRIYRARDVIEMLRQTGFSCSVAGAFGRFKLPSDRKVLVARAEKKNR